MGTRVHDSGMTNRSGKITKAGRRDLRTVLIEAANVAANNHPHWKAELARLEPRLGRNKAVVAIATNVLIAVRYVLQGKTDKYAEPGSGGTEDAALCLHCWEAQSTEGTNGSAIRADPHGRLGAGSEVTSIPWGSKEPIPLPPSKLKNESAVPNSYSSYGDPRGVLRERR